MNGIIHLPFVLSLAKDMVQRFPVRDGARAWLTGHQAHGCHIPCLYTRATRAAPNRIASANSATPAVGQSRKRHSTRSIQSLPARPARATPAPSTTRSPLGTRGKAAPKRRRARISAMPSTTGQSAAHSASGSRLSSIRRLNALFRKGQLLIHRWRSERAALYRPNSRSIRSSHIAIASPASAMSAPFQAGGQPVSCHVLPGNSIRG
jgi:hypothetical protein